MLYWVELAPFHCMSHEYGIVPIALYRGVDLHDNDNKLPYVYTCPSPDAPIMDGDSAFVLVQPRRISRREFGPGGGGGDEGGGGERKEERMGGGRSGGRGGGGGGEARGRGGGGQPRHRSRRLRRAIDRLNDRGRAHSPAHCCVEASLLRARSATHAVGACSSTRARSLNWKI